MEKIDLSRFFIENNQSGAKTKEKTLKIKYSELYKELIKFSSSLYFSDNLSFKEKIWFFINNIKEQPTCPTCGSPIKFGRSLSEGYNKYCSLKCANTSKEHIEKVKKTNNLRYGGNSPSSSPLVIKKIENTTFTKYGVKNVMVLDQFKNIMKEGCFKKYGVNYFLQSDIYRKKSLTKYADTKLVDTNIGNFTIYCQKCDKTHEINDNLFYYREKNGIDLCPVCTPPKIFVKEKTLLRFIKKSLPNINILQNTRSVIKPKELDIYIPSLKLGFELNGLYWHSSLFLTDNYHQDKQERAELKNIKLFQIFEDEWDNKTEIVKSMILNLLKLNSARIYARKCVIKELSGKVASEFLNNNHLQGYTPSTIKLGLYYQDELVSVMTFGTPRIIYGGNKKTDGAFELVRFASLLNTTVIGGASKLLKYFVKNYNPIKITTYADRRFSTGNLYKELGFTFKKYSQPNYFYLLRNKRLHRFNLNKQNLIKLGYDPKKTEKQITKENKIYRIYDCGSLVFEKTFN